MGHDLVLYSARPSFFSQIARLTLTEMGLPFSIYEIDIHGRLDQLDPSYAVVNSAMTVPSLVDDGRAVPGSDQILRHLAAAFPERRLDGGTDDERRRADAWVGTFYGFPIEYLTFTTLLRKSPLIRWGFGPKSRQAIRKMDRMAAEHPELQSVYVAKKQLMESRIKDLLAPTTGAEVEAALDRLLPQLDTALANAPWLAGAAYTVADVVATCVLARLAMIGLGARINAFPALSAYWAKIQERPSFKAADVWRAVKFSHAIREITCTVPKGMRKSA